MPSPIQNLIAALTGKAQPKSESISVTCPECGHEFDVDVDDDKGDESWCTADEAGETSGDPDDGDDDSEFEDSMNTPKTRAEREAAIAKNILLTAKQRDFVGAKPNEIGPQKSIEIVADKQIVENSSPADLLAKALNKLAAERK